MGFFLNNDDVIFGIDLSKNKLTNVVQLQVTFQKLFMIQT